MKTLFESIVLGGIPVRNRLVRSATLESLADEQGNYGPQMADVYRALAQGGIGTIITGMVGVDATSRVDETMVKAYGDTFEAELKKLVDIAHADGAKIVVQLAHCGFQAKGRENGLPAMVPTIMDEGDYKEYTQEEIKELVQSFAQAAVRCQKAGADGVQLHAAHGYLLNQFMSPLCNQRYDEYGGDITGRGRLILEAYQAIRDAVGPDYPIWIKINSSDLERGGITMVDCLCLCMELDKLGVNAIEVSAGLGTGKENSPAKRIKREEEEAYFFLEAQLVAEAVKKADVISVGGYRTPSVMEKRLNAGNVAAISMCRPLILEPGLPNRWQQGDTSPAKCISCNRCFLPGPLGCKRKKD